MYTVKFGNEQHEFEILNAAYEFIYIHRLVKQGKLEIWRDDDLVRELDEPEVPVIFRKWKSTGDVLAIMPTLSADVYKHWLCDSYMHVGQHGACNLQEVIPKTVLATEEEYRNLKAELERYPYFYNFKVYQRETPKMRKQRESAYKEWRNG
jgi:hypothetical protein